MALSKEKEYIEMKNSMSMSKKSKKCMYLNWSLIIITALTSVTSILRAIELDNNPLRRILTQVVLVIFVTKLILKKNLWGYRLCLINGYTLAVLKMVMIAMIFATINTIPMIALQIIDILLVLLYIFLGHWALKLLKEGSPPTPKKH